MSTLFAITTATLEGPAEHAWLVPCLPLLAALLIAFVTRSSGKLSALLSILAILGSLGVSLSIFLPRMEGELPTQGLSLPWVQLDAASGLGTIALGLLVDNLSSAMLVMVCFIGLLIQIYSFSYITKEVGHFPTQGSASVARFFAYLSLFVFSMLGLVLSDNLLQIYIFWELVGVCSYLLIGFWYFKTSAAQASKKAFVVTKFADLGFLLGVLTVGLGAGTFSFATLTGDPSVLSGLTPLALNLGLVLIFCGAVGKSAQFPLQIWLPDAMEGPTPVSALIHAATMVAAGVYMVARLFPLFFAAPMAGITVAYIGAITAFVAGSIAIVQNDIKRVLAYSTVSQLGFMMAALGCGAMTAGTFHLITHAFFKALLFLGSGAVIVACHNNDIWTMGGLSKRLPFTHATFAVGCLALAGMPPFAGFWSKDEILLGVESHLPVFLLLAATAFMTAFYVSRLYCIAFLGRYRGAEQAGEFAGPVPPADLPKPIQPSWEVFRMAPHWSEERAQQEGGNFPPECMGALSEHLPHDHHEPHEVSPMMYVPLLILSLFAFGLGFAGMPEPLGANHFHHLIHPPHDAQVEHPFNALLMGSSALIAMIGLGLGYSLYGQDPVAGERKLRGWLGPVWRFLQQKWYMDHLWAWLLAATLYRDSKVVAAFDEAVVDQAVAGVGKLTYVSGDKLRQEQTGVVQSYAMQMTLAVVILVLALGLLEKDFVLSMFRPLLWLKGDVQ